MKLSIVIPCYNEEQNIPLILEKFVRIIKRDDVEVILVNNGSLDNSEKVFNQLLPKYSFARTVKVKKNQGYGYGILAGLKEANGKFLGWTHADLQTDPHDPVKALEIIESKGGAENIFVKGNRKGRPFFDNFFTVGMSLVETAYLKTKLWDINAQPTVFSRLFYKKWRTPPHDFSLDLYAFYLAKKQGLKVIRFPVLFPRRIYGESSWNKSFKDKWKFIKRTIDYSLKLKRELRKNEIYSS